MFGAVSHFCGAVPSYMKQKNETLRIANRCRSRGLNPVLGGACRRPKSMLYKDLGKQNNPRKVLHSSEGVL